MVHQVMKRLLLVGLPKSGTTTVHRALTESGLTSAHYKWQGVFCGELMYRSYLRGVDPLLWLPECVTQADVCSMADRINLWPQMDYGLLDKVREVHPEIVLALNTRDPDAVIRSITGWKDYRSRLVRADVPGLPVGAGREDDELRDWIVNHYQRMRFYFESRKVRSVEFDIAWKEAPDILGAALGIKLAWWGVENASR